MSWQEACTGSCYVYRKRMVRHREGAAPGLDFSPFTRMSNYAATFTLIHNSYPLDVRLSCQFPVTLQWLIAVNILYRGMGDCLQCRIGWDSKRRGVQAGRVTDRAVAARNSHKIYLYRYVLSTIHQVQKLCWFYSDCCHFLRTKIVINDEILEQFSQFTYLCCVISYQISNDIEFKLAKFLINRYY